MHGMIQTEARLFISCDYFSVTPVFGTESMLLLKLTHFLEGIFKEVIFLLFSHYARSLGTAPRLRARSAKRVSTDIHY